MRHVLPAEPAVLVELEAIGRLLLVFRRAVIPAFAHRARQADDISHGYFARSSTRSTHQASGVGRQTSGLVRVRVTSDTARRLQPAACRPRYSRISVIVPAPTVRPP